MYGRVRVSVPTVANTVLFASAAAKYQVVCPSFSVESIDHEPPLIVISCQPSGTVHVVL